MPTPIVRLIPMDEAAFPAYRDYFIDDYAQDLASNHGLTLADARHQAEASLLQHLPQGAATFPLVSTEIDFKEILPHLVDTR